MEVVELVERVCRYDVFRLVVVVEIYYDDVFFSCCYVFECIDDEIY